MVIQNYVSDHTSCSPLQGLDVDVHPGEADFWAGRMGEMLHAFNKTLLFDSFLRYFQVLN